MTPQIKMKNRILDQENQAKKSMMSNGSSVARSQVEGSEDEEEFKTGGAGMLPETTEFGEDAVAGSVAQL